MSFVQWSGSRHGVGPSWYRSSLVLNFKKVANGFCPHYDKARSFVHAGTCYWGRSLTVGELVRDCLMQFYKERRDGVSCL